MTLPTRTPEEIESAERRLSDDPERVVIVRRSDEEEAEDL